MRVMHLQILAIGYPIIHNDALDRGEGLQGCNSTIKANTAPLYFLVDPQSESATV